MGEKKLKKLLRTIANEETPSIKREVAKEALSYGGGVESFFSDLLQHGCISGMVCSLVYYYDTHVFFNTHYREIEELRDEYEESTGEALNVQGDLMNFYAWFAFEETACKLACEMGIEV